VAGSWFAATNWNPEGIPGRLDTVVISSNLSSVLIDQVAVAGNLTVSSNTTLRVACSGTSTNVLAQTTLNTTNTDYAVGLKVYGNFLIAGGGRMALGGADQNSAGYLTVGGDLTVSNGMLAVYAGPTNAVTNAFWTGVTRVTVAGATTLYSNSWIHPFCDYRTGGGVLFALGDLNVAAPNAGFNANTRGYRFYAMNNNTYGNWPGYSGGYGYGGGSHGGRGGASVGGYISVPAYGYTNAPCRPGMPGGNNNMSGGGTLRINAGDITLNGVLTAEGGFTPHGGGSAGGGIWINCTSFTPGDNAWVSVKGSSLAGASANGGGGGGGRASICIGLSETQMAGLYASNATDNVTITPLADVLTTKFTAAGGTGYGTGGAGESGSGVYIVNTAGAVVLQVVGAPGNLSVVDPVYGPNTMSSGSVVPFSAVSPVSVSGDNRSRRVCGGYVVTNAAGEVKASGTTTNGSVTVNESLFMTWDWTQLEHVFGTAVNGCGTIVTNAISRPGDLWQPAGSNISLTAVPDSGHEFLIWTGDIVGGQRTNSTLTFVHDQPRALTAVFATNGVGTRTWTAGGDRTNWLDGANWSPAGVPGRHEAVLLTNGTVLLDGRMVAEVGSLTIGTNAFLRISSTGATVTVQYPVSAVSTETVGMVVHGDLTLYGKMSVGGAHQKCRSVLTVEGNLLLLRTNAQLAVNAGYSTPTNFVVANSLAAYREGGGYVTVRGSTTLETNCWIYPRCDGLSGAPVIFDLQDLTVAAGSGFNADNRGWYSYLDSIRGILYAYGPGSSAGNNYAGGCYGGKGGDGPSGHLVQGVVYGYTNAPYYPGSHGGNNLGAAAGGALRINGKTVRLDGTLTANGYDTGGIHAGGGAGGGIWLTCQSLKTSTSATISAKGGSAGLTGGGGGGGRVAIGIRMKDSQMASLYATGTAAPPFNLVNLLDPAVDRTVHVQGTLNLSGGAGAGGGFPGGDGSAVFFYGDLPGTVFRIR
jgi:hypothetical protein